jgi:hypothetical protein
MFLGNSEFSPNYTAEKAALILRAGNLSVSVSVPVFKMIFWGVLAQASKASLVSQSCYMVQTLITSRGSPCRHTDRRDLSALSHQGLDIICCRTLIVSPCVLSCAGFVFWHISTHSLCHWYKEAWRFLGKTHSTFFSHQEEHRNNMAAKSVIALMVLCTSHVSSFFILCALCRPVYCTRHAVHSSAV